jgi:DNA-binding transcriptional LysR family regulator
MLLKNYEYFLTIVKEGNISKAAAKLYVSQPSLSKYLKKLEKDADIELFTRDSHPLKLTPAGELFMRYIQDIIRRSKKLKRDFSDMKNSISGRVTVGITVWKSSILLPIVFPDFFKKYPNINIELREGSYQYILSLLEQNKIDFCILQSPNNYNNVILEHLTFEHILFTVNVLNPLLKKLDYDVNKKINTMSEKDFLKFKGEPFLMLKEGQLLRKVSQNFLNKLGINILPALETSNIMTAVNLVSAGMGVTFVPETILKIDENIKNLVFFKIDTPPLQWEIAIAYKTDALLSKPALLFIESIKKIYTNVTNK